MSRLRTVARVPVGARIKPRTVLVGVLLAYLAWQVLVPLAALLFSSFKDVRPSDPSFLDPKLTLSNYRSVLASGRLWKVSLNTAAFALGSSLLALVIGTFLAWVTTQTNARFRTVVSSLVLYQLAVPELLYPIAWTFILGPRVGLVNQWWMQWTGSEGPLFSIYSFPGMMWTQAFLLVPVVYLFAVPAISAVDRSLEDAAQVSGASPTATMRDVTLRLAAPALAATFILVLVRSWESFEVPWYLGVPVRRLTYSTQIYFSTVTPPSDTGLISAFAMPMLAVGVLLVLWYGKFNREARKYAVIGGRSFRSDAHVLHGKARWIIESVALGLVVVGIGLPLLMLVWMSLLPFYQQPSLDALQLLTLDSYAQVFTNENTLGAFRNSLVVGVGASILIVAVASLGAWLVLRLRVHGSRLIDTLTFLPMSIPNIIVGICFLWLYLLLPVGLVGSHLGLVLAYVTLFLAIGARNIHARTMQLHPELDEAARISGASAFSSFRTVIFPGLAPAVLASVIYVVLWAFKELPNALLLSSASTKTAAALMFDLSAAGTVADMAAVGVVTLAFLAVLLTGFQFFARRYGVRGF